MKWIKIKQNKNKFNYPPVGEKVKLAFIPNVNTQADDNSWQTIGWMLPSNTFSLKALNEEGEKINFHGNTIPSHWKEI